MQMRYKRYSFHEMLDILVNEPVYYSRHNWYGQGVLEADTISLRTRNTQLATGHCRTNYIEVVAAIAAVSDGMRELLEQNGFAKDERETKWIKVWPIALDSRTSPLLLISEVISTMDMAVNYSPLLLYETQTRKSIVDYLYFFSSCIPKIHRDDFLCLENYCDKSRDQIKSASKEKQADNCFVAEYHNGNWVSWLLGDDIIPVFSSKKEATSFLKMRMNRIMLVGNVEIKVILSGGKNQVYVLSDKMVSLQQRIRWLKNELLRMQEYERGYAQV